MTPYELMDLAIGVGNRIDVQLGIFITVHLAIFGGIIYVDRPLTGVEKLASMFVYSIFAFLNYRIMENQLNLQMNIAIEITALAGDPCCSDSPVVAYIAGGTERGVHDTRRFMLNAGHVFFYIVVLLSILFDQALTRLTRTGEEPS